MATVGEKLPKARDRLNIRSRESLVDDLGYFGRMVGPRTGPARRTHGEREDYCLRRWLIAAIKHDALPLPITIDAAGPDEAPDFVLRGGPGDDPLGVEVTEAGEATWQEWSTRLEMAEGPQPSTSPDGYARDQSERMCARDIRSAIMNMVERSGGEPSGGLKGCDLIVYENSEGGALADDARALDLLREMIEGETWRIRPVFRQIHVLFGNTMHLDVLGNGYREVDLTHDYADDWVGWLKAQAESLRKRDLEAVDFDDIAEELESLARSDKRKLHSQLARLLLHLLKWRFQPQRRARSWFNSINSARREVIEVLQESPSLEARALADVKREDVERAYVQARKDAIRETSLDSQVFPEKCPFSNDQILDRGFPPWDATND